MKKPARRASSAKSGRKRKAAGADGARKRRNERRLDPEIERWAAAAETQFEPAQSSMIPMLQAAQTTLGYLPRDAMQAIARHLGVPPAMVEGVASFYAQFRFNKPGRHRLTVCTGTACYVRGSGKLLSDLQSDLAIAAGETTEDGAVSLESVSCFGACALAPVVVLDDKVLRQQTAETLRKLVEDISTESPVPRPRGKRGAAAREAGA